MTTLDQAYQALHDEFVSATSYWTAGNALDTMIDYLVLYPAAAKGLEKDIADVFQRNTHNNSRCWYDDDGWWTIALARASHLSVKLGLDKALLAPAMFDAWNRFDRHAPKIWEKDKGVYPTLKPLVDGGVWNCGWPKDPCGGPANPTDRQGVNNLAGVQNTVTNGLYMVAAQRLALWGLDPLAGGHAEREYRFLSAWFDRPPHGADSLLYHLSHNAAVVRERVTAFDSDQPAWGYHPGQAWLGDQGLILGALVARLQSPHEPDKARAMAWAKKVLAGVPLYLSEQGSSVLLNWPASQLSPPGNDAGDYQTGRGVFFRYLLDAWSTNAELQTVMREQGWPAIVAANVGAEDPSSGIVLATNTLAVLLAAHTIV